MHSFQQFHPKTFPGRSRWPLVSAGLLVACVLDCAAARTRAAIEIVPAEANIRLFSGMQQTAPIIFQSHAEEKVTAELRIRLLQAGGSSAMRVYEAAWKKIDLLPQQRVLDQVPVKLPATKGAARFFVQLLDETQVLASIGIMALPTNILAELRPLSGGEEQFGVFDPANVLKPILAAQGVPFTDLQETGIAEFRGRLAIVGPFERRDQHPRDLSTRIGKLAGRGGAVVWMQPPPVAGSAPEPLLPSFREIAGEHGKVVLVQPGMLQQIGSSPEAQETLVSLCKIALSPEQTHLPTEDLEEQ